MNQQEITEGNKLIAEFMSKENPFHDGRYIVLNGFAYTPDEMKFNSSWDWIMPVVEKIESMRYSVTIGTAFRSDKTQRIYCEIGTPELWDFKRLDIKPIVEFDEENGNSKIEIVYISVVEFIKWYNQQK